MYTTGCILSARIALKDAGSARGDDRAEPTFNLTTLLQSDRLVQVAGLDGH
jgi:hypothetical protein